MTQKRYFTKKHLLRNDEIHDIVCHQFLNTDETVELLNRLEKDRQLLKELEQSDTQLKHRHSLLHDENQELECDKNEYYKDVVYLEKENEQLKQDNDNLIHLLENQSMIIQELHSKLMQYQLEEPIVLTKEDLEEWVKQ